MEDYRQLVISVQDQSANWRERHRAFAHLVRLFQDMAYGYALGRLGDRHLAEDAAQESFVTVWQQLPQLREPATFPGWLQRIVATHCYRVTRRKCVPTVGLDAAMHVPADMPALHAAAEYRELQNEVRGAIQSLGENERIAVTLFYIGDYSYAELSDFLGVPLSTVKKRLHSARLHLRERMTDMIKDALHDTRLSNGDEFVRRIEFFTAIKAGDVEQVRKILETQPDLTESTMTDGYGIAAQRALTAAIIAGHKPVVELFIARGVSVVEQDVREASQRGLRELARTVIATGVIDPLVSSAATAFFRAVHGGDIDAVAAEISAHPDLLTEADRTGRTALMIAAGNGYLDVIALLLDLGTDPATRDATGLDALHHAAANCNWCWTGQPEAIELLAERGSPYDIFTVAGAGVLSLVQKLVEAQPALINAENDQGETPLECAVKGFSKGAGTVIEYLRSREPVMNIWMAAQFGQIDRVRASIIEDPTAATRPRSASNDKTPIHYAAQNWCPQTKAARIVDLLAEHGANVNEKAGPFEWAPLHAVAEWWNDTEIADALLRHGADINSRSAMGWTPLRYATALGREEMAAFLGERGAEE